MGKQVVIYCVLKEVEHGVKHVLKIIAVAISDGYPAGAVDMIGMEVY